MILEADYVQHYYDKQNCGVDYIYIKDDSEIFHRTKYINMMLSSIKNPFAAIWDADVIADPVQIELAYRILKEKMLLWCILILAFFLDKSVFK